MSTRALRRNLGRSLSDSRLRDGSDPAMPASASRLRYRESVLALSPWAYWNFDVASGELVLPIVDQAGNSLRKLYPRGGGTFGVEGARGSHAWKSDGTAWSTFLVEQTVFNSSPATFTFWCKLHSLAASQELMGCWEAVATDKVLWCDTSGKLGFHYYNGANRFTSTPATSLVTGRWYHIAVSTGAAGGKVYIDGVLEGSNAEAGSYAGYSSPNLRVGYVSGGRGGPPLATIDEVAVWASQLSDADVAGLLS